MNKLVTKMTIDIINRFRDVCVSNGFNEELAVSIVSHHDQSIRFTNSTTSVFKPFLQNVKEMGDGVFLIQPAIGLQGVEYWSKSHEFGPFSSFFYSCGILCRQNSIDVCKTIIKQYLFSFFKPSELLFVGRKEDRHFWGEFADLPVHTCENQELSRFRHQYGLEDYKGVDILIIKKSSDREVEFGNISMICRNKNVIGIEFSVDSTLLLSALLNRHAVLCLPGVDSIEKLEKFFCTEDLLVPMLDFCELICMLFIDGLRPGARGRRGNLKKIIGEIEKLLVTLQYPKCLLQAFVSDILESELLILSNTTYIVSENLIKAEEIIDYIR